MKTCWPWVQICVVILLIFGMAFINPAQAADLVPQASTTDGLPPGWVSEHPVLPHIFSNMGPHSLAIDSDGHLHYAYGGDHLYYTHNDGAGWFTPEIVDPSVGVGQGAALALDPAGNVHISYADTATRILRYATNKSGVWVVTKFNSLSEIDSRPALALDTSGLPHILVYHPTDDTLSYCHLLPDGTWEFYPIGNGGAGISLAIGSDNILHIAYTQEDIFHNDCLFHRIRDGSGWQEPDKVYCPSESGLIRSDIRVDSQNLAHVVWLREGYNTIGYKYQIDSGWSAIQVYTSNYDSDYSLAVGSDNLARLSLQHSSGLRFTYNDGGSFVMGDLVDPGATNGQFNSLVLDPNDEPRTTYFNPTTGELVSRAKSGILWQDALTIDTVDTGVGPCTSLVYDASGKAHLTFFDSGTIKYATRYPGGSWVVSMHMIHPINPVACEHSLSLHGSTPAIAYSMESGQLRYAEYTCLNGCGWKTYPIVELAWVPESSSLGFTSAGKPRISFVYSSQVYLAYNNGTDWTSGWEVSRVDAATADGQTSLVIDSNDRAHIAYFHSADSDLYYAMQDGYNPLTWHTPQLVDSNLAGGAVSLQLYTPFHIARIAYTGLDGSLRYRQQAILFPDVVWQPIQSVSSDSALTVRLDPGSTGQPRIFWYNDSGEHLNISTRMGNLWQNQDLDSNFLTGKGLDLAVSPVTGKVTLSCFDENVSGIKILTEHFPVFLPLTLK